MSKQIAGQGEEKAIDGKKAAKAMTNSKTLSAIAIHTFTSKSFKGDDGRDTDLKAFDLYSVIEDKANAVNRGDMAEVEEMLISQALTLDTIFNQMALKAALNMGEYMQATETYLRMALKAQGQCRATLETLAEIKNPRSVTITRQANIAGQQVVNNGNMVTGGNSSHAGENQNQENELLGEVHHERLDTGTAQTAGGTYQDVEAVGTINGGANGGRKSQKRLQ